MRQVFTIALLSFLGITHVSAATIQIVCDNDFAVFAGTNSSISRLVYQNNVGWQNQAADALAFDFNLQNGETDFYLLAMDAPVGFWSNGAIYGSFNGVNILDLAVVQQSSDLSSYLSGYSSSVDAISDGSFSVTLTEVQGALGNLTWFTPSPSFFYGTPSFSLGFSQANLFKFTADSVGVSQVPEPSTYGLGLAGLAIAFAAVSRRRK